AKTTTLVITPRAGATTERTPPGRNKIPGPSMVVQTVPKMLQVRTVRMSTKSAASASQPRGLVTCMSRSSSSADARPSRAAWRKICLGAVITSPRGYPFGQQTLEDLVKAHACLVNGVQHAPIELVRRFDGVLEIGSPRALAQAAHAQPMRQEPGDGLVKP